MAMNQHVNRRGQLIARCQAQRVALAAHVDEIESRLQGTDQLLGTVVGVMKQPALLASAAAMALAMGHAGWWSKLSRGVMLLAGVRRLYLMLRR